MLTTDHTEDTMRSSNLPAIGSRVTGRCRTLNLRRTVTVTDVTRDRWPGAYGYTVHGVTDDGRTVMMGAETCESAA